MNYIIYARRSSEDKKKQVQSIPDQLAWAKQKAKDLDLNIISTFSDIKTGTKPDIREGFAEMIKFIYEQSGPVGILSWKINRLARNPIDEGKIKYAFMQKKITHILASDREFRENDNQILMGVEFGQATQFSIDLSKDVKRGMNSKVNAGWRPCKAPLGYLNEKYAEKGKKRVLSDPKTFKTVQKLWHLLLERELPLAKLYELMKTKYPLLRNGKILSFSTFHAMFHNPFYGGRFRFNGLIKQGAHQPMISWQEFLYAQNILDTGKEWRESKGDVEQFPYKGIFRCQNCDAMITAESHTKKIKTTGEMKTYDYYRCAHRKNIEEKCTEKPLNEIKLEEQLLQIVDTISLPSEIIKFGLDTIKELKEDVLNKHNNNEEEENVLKVALARIKREITICSENVALAENARIREITTNKLMDLEKKQEKIIVQLHKLTEYSKCKKIRITKALQIIESAQRIIKKGTKTRKRELLQSLGSNWCLGSKKLDFKPFHEVEALQKTKRVYDCKKKQFEPTATRSTKTKKLPQELVVTVWSG